LTAQTRSTDPSADRGPRPRPQRQLQRIFTGLIGAVGFLTIIPIPAAIRPQRLELRDALGWFPLLGAGIGAFSGGLALGSRPLLGRGPGTVIAMVGLVLISGALHQDALADTADGLGVRGDRTRRLAAMRDSATGAFGVLALIAWALLLFSTLESLSARHAFVALISACSAGRLAALLHAGAAAPARQDGLGAAVRVTAPAALIATLSALVVMVAAVGVARGLMSAGVCGLVGLGSAALARRTLGGSTGDTIGAAVAVCELAVCVALLGTWH
jgi:adenosylcobinamide-GDP ribazoletransferase